MTLKNRFLALAKKHRIAVVILLLEALGAALTTAVFVAGTIVDSITKPEIVSVSLGGYIAIDLIFLAATLVAFFTARQLIFQKRWARSSAVYWQLIQIALAWNSFTGDVLGYFFGGWLAGSAGVALYFLFSKEVIDGTAEKIDRE